MADQKDKSKQPPKTKITIKGKSRKLPKIKLSESQVSRPKKDTSKVPKIGVETNPKAETSRIPLPDSIKAKGLKIGKLAEDVVPHQYTDAQLAEAAKRRTMRVEIAEEMLDEDTIIATPEELGIKPGNRDATIPIDPTSIDTISDTKKFASAAKSSTAEMAKSVTAQIDPLSIEDDSQEIEPVSDKKSTVAIDPETTSTGDTDRLKPLKATTAEIAKSVTAKIDPLSIEDDSQEILPIEDKKSTVAIDPETTSTGDTDRLKPLKATTAEIAKSVTAQIDPLSIEDDSQEILPLEDKKSTVAIDPSTTSTGDTDRLNPLSSPRDELAKSTTAQIDPASILDDSQPITQKIPEVAHNQTVEIPLVDIEDSAEIKQVEEPTPVAKEPPPEIKKPTAIKKPTPIKKAAAKIEKPAAVEEIPEGIVEGPPPDSDIFKATTMAMDADEIESKIQDEDTAIDTPNPEIFKAQTMDLNEIPKSKATKAKLKAPKTVKLKKPAGAMPSTVKLKKGKPAAPKADTTRVDLPESAMDAAIPRPAKTVKLKKPMPAAKPAGLNLDSSSDTSSEPDFEFAATGTDDSVGTVFSILSLLSLLVSFGVIYFLYSSITLINSY